MSKKGLIMIIVGVAVAILVTGGLVFAAGVGGKGCATEGVRGQAAGEARVADCQGAGGENASCNSDGTCDGDCATCENQECVKNQGAESAIKNAFNNAEGECAGTGTCDANANANANANCNGDGAGQGNCNGDGAGQGNCNGNGQQGMTCPMR